MSGSFSYSLKKPSSTLIVSLLLLACDDPEIQSEAAARVGTDHAVVGSQTENEEKKETVKPVSIPVAATPSLDHEPVQVLTPEASPVPDPVQEVPRKSKKSKKKKSMAPTIDGKALYQKSCKKCHGATGNSETKMGRKYEIPPLKGNKISQKKAEKVIREGVPETKMKGYRKKLSAEEITALSQFVVKF